MTSDDGRSELEADGLIPGVELLEVVTEVDVPPEVLFATVLDRPLLLPMLSTDRLCVLIFSSRRHFARLFENQTYNR